MRYRKQLPYAAATMVAVNILVFIPCLSPAMANRMLDKGDLNLYSFFVNREYWRIVTAMFLHANVAHLFNNMLILFFLGTMLEEKLGHILYTVFYFLCGIGGNVLSLISKLRTEDMAGSIGASGVVFGLDGILLALVLFDKSERSRYPLPRVLVMIFLSLYSGYTGHNIDNAAHVGGLITGFLCGALFSFLPRKRK